MGATALFAKNSIALNVEKRVGVGGTINMAHPAGKVISGNSAEETEALYSDLAAE